MNIDIRKFIDNSLLRPHVDLKQVEDFVLRSSQIGFYAVCLHPYHIRFAYELVGKDIVLCSVVGFPLGLDTKEEKIHQAVGAVTNGAREIDMVMNLSAFKSGNYRYVEEEVKAIKRETGAVLKVIIETHYLNEEEKIKATDICASSGADFVKTSTGFAPTGAKVEDVKLLRSVARNRLKVKASGGIRDLRTALAMIGAGADRIGTSSGFEIYKEAVQG